MIHLHSEVILEEEEADDWEEVDEEDGENSSQEDGAAIPCNTLDHVQESFLPGHQVKQLQGEDSREYRGKPSLFSI